MSHVPAIVVALAALLAAPAAAHTRSQSFSSWHVEGDEVTISFSVRSREVTRLPPLEGPIPQLDALLAAHLRERIGARSGEQPCRPLAEPRPLAAQPGFERVELRLVCPPGSELWIRVESFFEVAPGHVHFARVRIDGGAPVEHLLTAGRTRAPVSGGAGAGAGASFAGYVRLGVEHIAGGLDHLAFLAALLLLLPDLRQVAWVITGFTLGHSITLSLAVLGLVRPHAELVEALIGFTIALVAVENIGVASGRTRQLADLGGGVLAGLAILGALSGSGPAPSVLLGLALFTGCYLRLVHDASRARRVRPAITALFGLVHGLGFASVLLQVGLPRDRLLPALLGFNVGVELGQLLIVGATLALAALLLARWRKLPRALLGDACSALLCALGVYWFVSRAYG